MSHDEHRTGEGATEGGTGSHPVGGAASVPAKPVHDGHRVELRVGDPVADPGLGTHEPRPTDIDPAAEKRAERQISLLFAISALLTLGFCVAYFAIPRDTEFAGTNALNLTLGVTLGLALLLIGIGAIQWAKTLMDDHEMVEMRHGSSSSAEDRAEALAAFEQGADESGFGRRSMLRGTLLTSLGVLGLPAVVLLADLGPLPGDDPRKTVWAKGVHVVNDVDGKKLRLDDIQFGQLVNGQPGVFFETEDGEPLYEGTELLNAKAKASVVLVRMVPDEIVNAGSAAKGVEGVLCFSKICPHLGCPISLWEQQTKNLICPCHQSTFDLADGGSVVFGPAKRAVAQLELGLDEEGYLIAMGDFPEPVGPSFPEFYQD
ncbi:MAG: Rieske (2Fe-2S) protein [Nocardioidaceae bacterium]|nr:Rieske (2Fe-2S) protein [Nocardioidaceae bacterium]